MKEAREKVENWAFDNGFEYRKFVGLCRDLPFGHLYIDFKGEDVEVALYGRGDMTGRLRRPLNIVEGHWLTLAIKDLCYKYVDKVLFNE
jgi:hypothetical protein